MSLKKKKIRRLTKLGETCRKIIEGEITLLPQLTEEDYNFSIGRFIKIKETRLQKKFHLDFNLNNNKNIIWDTLFLSEVISREITDPNTIKEIPTEDKLQKDITEEIVQKNKYIKQRQI